VNKQTRIAVVVAVFIGLPYLFSLWQNWRTTNDSSTRDDTGEIVESGTVGIFVVKLGDCVLIPSSWRNAPDEGVEVSQVQGVPCTELHDGEVVGEIIFDDEGFPGQEVLFARMDEFCIPAYENYTGASFSESPHDYLPLVPTSDSWTQGDRIGQCFAVNIDGEQLGASIRE
jgi:hypothetical protein